VRPSVLRESYEMHEGSPACDFIGNSACVAGFNGSAKTFVQEEEKQNPAFGFGSVNTPATGFNGSVKKRSTKVIEEEARQNEKQRITMANSLPTEVADRARAKVIKDKGTEDMRILKKVKGAKLKYVDTQNEESGTAIVSGDQGKPKVKRGKRKVSSEKDNNCGREVVVQTMDGYEDVTTEKVVGTNTVVEREQVNRGDGTVTRPVEPVKANGTSKRARKGGTTPLSEMALKAAKGNKAGIQERTDIFGCEHLGIMDMCLVGRIFPKNMNHYLEEGKFLHKNFCKGCNMPATELDKKKRDAVDGVYCYVCDKGLKGEVECSVFFCHPCTMTRVEERQGSVKQGRRSGRSA
jgi:hypothetical protein